MDTSEPEGSPPQPQIELLIREVGEQRKLLNDLMIRLNEPKKDGRTKARWRELFPYFEDLVKKNGYVTSNDGKLKGLDPVRFDRLACELITNHPDWVYTVFKHRRIVHIPGVNPEDVILSTITYENYSPSDPTVLQYMISMIKRSGRLNVLDDLQRNHPKTSVKWRDDFLIALQKFIEHRGVPIQRESLSDGRLSDFFAVKEPSTGNNSDRQDRDAQQNAREMILKSWKKLSGEPQGRREAIIRGWMQGPAQSGILTEAGFFSEDEAIDWCRTQSTSLRSR